MKKLLQHLLLCLMMVALSANARLSATFCLCPPPEQTQTPCPCHQEDTQTHDLQQVDEDHCTDDTLEFVNMLPNQKHPTPINVDLFTPIAIDLLDQLSKQWMPPCGSRATAPPLITAHYISTAPRLYPRA